MIYVVYGIVAVLVVLILVFGFGVLFLGKQQPEEPKVATTEETKSGFFAKESGATNLAVGKAKLDGGRSSSDFLTENVPSRNSLPVRDDTTEDEFKL